MSLQQKYFKEHKGILHGRKNAYETPEITLARHV